MTSLLRNSFILFLDGIILSIGGWMFWLIISRLSDSSSIGIATTILSIASFLSSFATLGLEYPILKKASNRIKINFGSILAIELIVHAVLSIPILIYFIGLGEPYSFSEIVIGIALLFSIGIGFIAKHVLLGVMDAKFVLTTDVLGTILKFAITLALLPTLGLLAILLGILLQQIFLCLIMLYQSIRKTSLVFVPLRALKGDLYHGIVNLPSKAAKIIILNLSVVVLAAAGVQYAEVGVFYILLMISIAAASLASSLAVMSIPAFSIDGKDYSNTSLRLGLAISVPLLSLLVAAPEYVLTIVNPNYTSYSDSLIILGFSMVGYIITLNAITKANNYLDLRLLILLGITETVVFLILFFVLDPLNLVLVSTSVLAAYISTSIMALSRMKTDAIITCLICTGAIFSSWLIRFVLELITGNTAIAISLGIISSITVVLISRTLTFRELRNIAYEIIQQR